METNDLQMFEEGKSKIHAIRGVQVMLDRDLADLYEVKNIRLREQFKRNIERFPKDFAFQLTKEETKLMVSQNAIPSKQQLGGHLPYVFTEQGVAMLSGVLRGDKAVGVNIQIMRAFVSMRRFISTNAQIFQRTWVIEQKLLEHDKNFTQIFDAIESKQITPNQGIFFEGQVFDGHVFASDLIRKAKSSLVLIDNYIDDSVLTLFSTRMEGVKVIIYTKDISKKLMLDLERFNTQYGPIKLKKFTKSHDRFLIIDDKEVYHIGASFKDLGKKWFAFSRLHLDVSIILDKLGGDSGA